MDTIPIIRQIDSDNSCLFNAFSYVYDKNNHNDSSSLVLRNIIAQVISQNPIKYNTSFLGKSNPEYQEFIINPKKWGGAIELSILSDYFSVQICTFDIQSLKRHCFGESIDYQDRVYLLYNGTHYDALVMSMDKALSTDFDITKFSPNDNSIAEKFYKLVVELHSNGQYTALANLILLCNDCNTILKNTEEAVKHAKITGHTNMEQIK